MEYFENTKEILQHARNLRTSLFHCSLAAYPDLSDVTKCHVTKREYETIRDHNTYRRINPCPTRMHARESKTYHMLNRTINDEPV